MVVEHQPMIQPEARLVGWLVGWLFVCVCWTKHIIKMRFKAHTETEAAADLDAKTHHQHPMCTYGCLIVWTQQHTINKRFQEHLGPIIPQTRGLGLGQYGGGKSSYGTACGDADEARLLTRGC